MGQASNLCADQRPNGSITLDPASVHLLSNHLAVIVGFVELMLVDAAPNDPRRPDLLEVRTAAVEAAKLIGQTQRS